MQKTQTGWVIIGAIFLVNLIVLAFYGDTQAIILLPVISVVLLLLFYRLTIKVDNTSVTFTFGIGFIRGTYRLDQIQRCNPIKYVPMGWGIRWRPGVILFNVSGNKAIELDLKNKKRKRWLGTDSPDELAKFINSKLLAR